VPQDVSLQYRACIAARQATREALDTSDARFAYARLAMVALAVLFAILSWRAGTSPLWLLVPVTAFAWLARRHDRVLRARDAAVRGIAFYERGLARIEDRWPGTGESGERFRDDRHVYANDLDLFGRGSLFELLSLARTAAGEATLAGWLTSPADAREIRTRQEAVNEIAPALDLRERLAIAGTSLRESVQTDRLLHWAESPLPPDAALRVLTWAFTVAAVVLVLFMAITSVWWPLAAVGLLEAAAFRRLRDRINEIVSGRDPESTATFVADALTHRARDLDVISGLLTNLERERFASDRLRRLHGKLTADGQPASRVIRRLQRCAEIHDSTANAGLLPLGLFLLGQLELALSLAALMQLITPHLALVVARWRRRHGTQVRGWLETIAEFEALTSLAAYRHEHPDDPFPEIVSPGDDVRAGALFDGKQLGHPLLPAASMVRNDVSLGGAVRLLVVSGSNMSGKSTVLRTVGVNAVLALAGAPVRAASLRLRPLAIGATLRIQDSLLEGRSRFYAEITRIRELADTAAGPVPLLFLLDELFHGTNSHDRRTGAAGVLQSVLDRGAIGLVTTHDLALTSIADELSPSAVNVHFEDWFDGQDIRFDYLMKSGPVTRSNALALMRAVGLDVPSQT
jgi:hypothetical protein